MVIFLKVYYDLNGHNEWDIDDMILHLHDLIFQMSLVLPVPIYLLQDRKFRLYLKNVHHHILLKIFKANLFNKINIKYK